MPFFEVEKVGAVAFLTREMGGGGIVFLARKNPQNLAGVPGKFWAVPYEQCYFVF